MSRRKLVKVGTQRQAHGDAAYRVSVLVDPRELLERYGQAAAFSKGGKATLLGGAVVIVAKQANVARGDF